MHSLLQVTLWHLLLTILSIPALLTRPIDDEAELLSGIEELADVSSDQPFGNDFKAYKDVPNKHTPMIVEQEPHTQSSQADFDFEQWNTLTICTVIATITFLLVWVIFWLIFHTESAEFQKAQQVRTKSDDNLKNHGTESQDTSARKSTTSSKPPKPNPKPKKKNAKKQTVNSNAAHNTLSGARVTHSIALMPLPRILENNGNGSLDETRELFIADSCEDVAVQCEDEDADFDCETISGKNVDNLSNINLYHGSMVGSTGTVSQIVVQMDESYENIPIN